MLVCARARAPPSRRSRLRDSRCGATRGACRRACRPGRARSSATPLASTTSPSSARQISRLRSPGSRRADASPTLGEQRERALLLFDAAAEGEPHALERERVVQREARARRDQLEQRARAARARRARRRRAAAIDASAAGSRQVPGMRRSSAPSSDPEREPERACDRVADRAAPMRPLAARRACALRGRAASHPARSRRPASARDPGAPPRWRRSGRSGRGTARGRRAPAITSAIETTAMRLVRAPIVDRKRARRRARDPRAAARDVCDPQQCGGETRVDRCGDLALAARSAHRPVVIERQLDRGDGRGCAAQLGRVAGSRARARNLAGLRSRWRSAESTTWPLRRNAAASRRSSAGSRCAERSRSTAIARAPAAAIRSIAAASRARGHGQSGWMRRLCASIATTVKPGPASGGGGAMRATSRTLRIRDRLLDRSHRGQ